MNWESLLDEKAIAALLPVDYAHFAKPVCDGLAVFLGGLPVARQTEIFALQATLSPSADVSERLGLLARSCPVLQKIGQILARDQRLSPVLRLHLRQLESLPPTVPLETIQNTLVQQLGPLGRLGITLTPPALAEASVAVVVPFRQQRLGSTRDGVFKILKPGIEQLLEEELGLLELVGSHLDERCDDLQIPHLDYQEAFQQVRDKLREEVCLDHEQRHLAMAREFYADEDRVQIPALFDCCTSQVTAMQRVWGDKVTEHSSAQNCDRRELAHLVIDAMIAQPIFSKQAQTPLHGDPHAGNLFLTNDGRLAILDWSLVSWLTKQEREAIMQVMLGAIMQDERRMVAALNEMAEHEKIDHSKLRLTVKNSLRGLRHGQFPGLIWLVSMLDEAVRDARLRLKPDLMMFRKSFYTLEGVVAEVGASTVAFDQLLCLKFLQQFAIEWPYRWFSSPNSREFATSLSNFDLVKAILDFPTSVARFWMAEGSDLLNASRTKSKVT